MKNINLYEVEVGFVTSSGKIYTRQTKKVCAENEEDAVKLAIDTVSEMYEGTSAGRNNGVSYVAIDIKNIETVWVKD